MAEISSENEKEAYSRLLAQLQTSFKSGVQTRFDDMRAVLMEFKNGGDPTAPLKALHGLAHRLSGAAGTFGVATLAEAAKRLDDECTRLVRAETSGMASRPNLSRLVSLTTDLITIDIGTVMLRDEVSSAIYGIEPPLTQRDGSIFILDDDESVCEWISLSAMGNGYKTDFLTNSTLFPLIYNTGLNLMFLDLDMPGMDGVEIIRFLAQKNSQIGLVLMTHHDDAVLYAARDLAIGHGLNVHGILQKPFLPEDLVALFRRLADIELASQPMAAKDKSFPQTGSDELPSVADLESAITNRDLTVSYHPLVNIQNNVIVAFEALARWRHREKGAIPPNYFIALAEEYDLIAPLTTLVLNKATDDMMNFPELFDGVNIAVNISEKLLSDLTLPENLLSVVHEKRLNPRKFTFEITENTINTNLNSALDVLTRIRLKGAALSIDDFGTGHSSLSRLRKLPFNEIKIDKSFVSNFDHDFENRIIVENTIALAKNLSMRVIAEGVEKRVHLDLLKKLGCDLAQGFFYCRPMSIKDLLPWAEEWRNTESST